jgi:Protein of unknown function (DUF2905)
MTARDLGLAIALVGLVLVVVGALVATGALGWFGRLPGDLRFEGSGGRVRVFAPLASMVVVSVVLSAVLWVVRRWLG